MHVVITCPTFQSQSNQFVPRLLAIKLLRMQQSNAFSPCGSESFAGPRPPADNLSKHLGENLGWMLLATSKTWQP